MDNFYNYFSIFTDLFNQWFDIIQRNEIQNSTSQFELNQFIADILEMYKK